ncbi:glycosyltransferase [Acidobacteriota bacterium]
MKICIISYHSCPYTPLGGDGAGGMSVYLKELSSLLIQDHHVEIDIFTRAQNGVPIGPRDVAPSLRVIHLKAGPETYLDREKLFRFLPEFMKNLETHLDANKLEYDLIYSHYWLSGLAGEWIKQIYEVPLIHTYHTLAFFKEHVLGSQGDEIRRMAEDHLAEVADRIISSSSQEREYLVDAVQVPKDRVEMVYPGVNEDIFFYDTDETIREEVDLKGNEKLFLYVGRIEPVKGLKTVVEALNHLKEADEELFSSVKLAVIGGGSSGPELDSNLEVKEVRSLLESSGLGEKVLFLGSQPQDRLRFYYSAADALVVPSLYESFGLVVTEALACGTPVFVSKIGEMQNFIRPGKNGYSFTPEDPVSLGQTIRDFSHNQGVSWPKSRIREDVIKKVSWEKTAAGVYRVFEGAVAGYDKTKTKFQPGGTLRQA